jgi:hypothetical protein
MVRDDIVEEAKGDQTYWLAPDRPIMTAPSPTAYLLPNYDEYLISYRHNSQVLNPAHAHLIERSNPIFAHFILIDGHMVGTWRREFQKKEVIITPNPFEPLSPPQRQAIQAAAEQYGRFLGLTATVIDRNSSHHLNR